jgi:hypothetical protein
LTGKELVDILNANLKQVAPVFSPVQQSVEEEKAEKTLPPDVVD